MRTKVFISLTLVIVILLSACTSAQPTPTEVQEQPTLPPTEVQEEPTLLPTETSSAPRTWPEVYNFCRDIPGKDEAECWSLTSVEEWLALPPLVGDVFWGWPEFMDLPPLPEDMKWKRQREDSSGENYWLVVEATIARTSIPSTPDVTEDWPVYENDVLGYSFKYPSECFFGPMPANCKQSPPEERAPECLCFLDAENPNEVFMQAFLPDPDQGLRLASYHVVHYDSAAFNPPAGMDLIPLLNDQFSYPPGSIPSEPNFIIDDVPAAWVSIAGGRGATSSDEIYFIWNDQLVKILMLDMEADQLRELYEQILSTFQFLD